MHGCIGLNPTRSRISCAGKKIRAKLHTIIKAINYPSPVIINTKRIPSSQRGNNFSFFRSSPHFHETMSPIFFVQNKKKKKRKNDQHFHPHHTIHFNSKLGPYQPINTPPSINPVSLESRYLGQSFSWKKRVDPGKSLITVAWIKGRGGGGIGVH